MAVFGIISHLLWENQFKTLNKRFALVIHSVQGLDFELRLPSFFFSYPPLKVFPLVNPAILPPDEVKDQLPFIC